MSDLKTEKNDVLLVKTTMALVDAELNVHQIVRVMHELEKAKLIIVEKPS